MHITQTFPNVAAWRGRRRQPHHSFAGSGGAHALLLFAIQKCNPPTRLLNAMSARRRQAVRQFMSSNRHRSSPPGISAPGPLFAVFSSKTEMVHRTLLDCRGLLVLNDLGLLSSAIRRESNALEPSHRIQSAQIGFRGMSSCTYTACAKIIGKLDYGSSHIFMSHGSYTVEQALPTKNMSSRRSVPP